MRWLLLALTCAVNPPHACRTVVIADYPYADWCESGRQFKERFPGVGEIKVWCEPKTPKKGRTHARQQHADSEYHNDD